MKISITRLTERPDDWPPSFMDTNPGSNHYFMMDTPERDVTVEYSPNDYRICFNGDTWIYADEAYSKPGIVSNTDEVINFFNCLEQYMLPGHGTLKNECFECGEPAPLTQLSCDVCNGENERLNQERDGD